MLLAEWNDLDLVPSLSSRDECAFQSGKGIVLRTPRLALKASGQRSGYGTARWRCHMHRRLATGQISACRNSPISGALSARSPPICAFQQVVNHRELKSRAHGSACLRAHSLQERASTTKSSTRFTALEVPDRTQKNQDDADSVEPVDQREEPGMAARGHQAGESQYNQQHSWKDGDHARHPQGRLGLSLLTWLTGPSAAASTLC